MKISNAWVYNVFVKKKSKINFFATLIIVGVILQYTTWIFDKLKLKYYT